MLSVLINELTTLLVSYWYRVKEKEQFNWDVVVLSALHEAVNKFISKKYFSVDLMTHWKSDDVTISFLLENGMFKLIGKWDDEIIKDLQVILRHTLPFTCPKNVKKRK